MWSHRSTVPLAEPARFHPRSLQLSLRTHLTHPVRDDPDLPGLDTVAQILRQDHAQLL